MRLTPADAKQFEEKIGELMDDLRTMSSDQGAETYSCTVAFVPWESPDGEAHRPDMSRPRRAPSGVPSASLPDHHWRSRRSAVLR